jgi:hypothetical protein
VVLGFAAVDQVLEMRVRLALRHLAPAPLLEEALHVGADARRAEFAADALHGVEAFVMVLLDRLATPREIAEGVPVRGQRERHVRHGGHAIERVEERVERILREREAGDVRRDRGEHVVAREEEAVGRIMQTDVILGVTRRVRHEPLALREPQDLVGADGLRDLRHERASDRAEEAPAHAHPERRARMLTAPRRAAAPGLDDAPMRVVVLALRGQVVDGDLGVLVALEHAEAKAAVRHDLRVRLPGEARGAAEVIRVRVRDDHRVDVLRPESGLSEPVLDRAPGVGTGHAGVDDGGAALVEQRVHVDVTEARHPDRELHAQHVRSDFRDLALRRLLLLSVRPRHGRRRVRKRAALRRRTVKWVDSRAEGPDRKEAAARWRTRRERA